MNRRLFKLLEGRLFLDAKLADIPNTVSWASTNIASLGVRMLSVHASAGSCAMEETVKYKDANSLVLAATLLTSIEEKEYWNQYSKNPEDVVYNMALKANYAGVDGIICSPKELRFLRSHSIFDKLILVTPGIRPLWAVKDDQKRFMTPRDAMLAGADYLVIGRPITKPNPDIGSPSEAAELIAIEINEALGEMPEYLILGSH